MRAICKSMANHTLQVLNDIDIEFELIALAASNQNSTRIEELLPIVEDNERIIEGVLLQCGQLPKHHRRLAFEEVEVSRTTQTTTTEVSLEPVEPQEDEGSGPGSTKHHGGRAKNQGREHAAQPHGTVQ